MQLSQRPVQIWLLACMAMVAIMVFIGGITRLTESGLSIVEWKLVTGVLPPFTQEGWEAELAEYRASPEYKQVNRGMSIAEFKQIYWLEWVHRLLGRLTGLVFFLPLIFFTLRKQISPELRNQMLLACLLVSAQGAIGWLMVYSGLQNDPRVSPVRLALHLSMAFGLFCYLYWVWLKHHHIARGYRLETGDTLPALAGVNIRIVTACIALQIIFGALVAGLDAGLIYNSWPMMDGDFIPPHLLNLKPWYRNLIEYVPMVQWQHRTFAYVVAAAVLSFVLFYWHLGPRGWLCAFLALLSVQFLLGVLTLVHSVPITLASAHQVVALALLAVAIRLCYAYPLASRKKARLALQSA